VYFAGRSESGDGRPSPQECMLRSFREFPDPVAVVLTPPGGTHQLGGGQSENGRPYSIHVTYTTPNGQRLLVRTKARPLPVDPKYPPPFVTVDTLRDAFGIYGRHAVYSPPPRGAAAEELEAWRQQRVAEFRQGLAEYEALPKTPVSILIDAVPVPGFRVDHPDCSGVELAWDGPIVQCVGDAAAIDVLELRRAVPEDFL
jgi:hypothetical protein